MPLVIDLNPGAEHKLVNIKKDNSSIYRVIDIHHLFDIFKTNSITLVQPKMWEDPYENFFANSFGVDSKNNDIIYSFESYTKNIFGLCWSLVSETDATWRIYSPNKDKAKIRTNIKKLYQILSKIDEDFFQSYIGKVKYCSEKTIRTNIKKVIKKLSETAKKPNLIQEFYLMKRNVFKHEKEVRLLVKLPYISDDKIHPLIHFVNEQEICKIPIKNPNDFIEEIIFDPRMPDSLVYAYKYYLENNFNYSNKIYKSEMYECPNIRETVNHRYGSFM